MCEFWHMVWQEKIRVIAMTTYRGNRCEVRKDFRRVFSCMIRPILFSKYYFFPVRQPWEPNVMLNLLTTCHQTSLLLIILSLKDIDQYMPNSIIRSVEKGNFLIQLMSDNTYSCFNIRHIQITCKEVSYCSGV